MTIRVVRIAFCIAPLVLLVACTSSKPARVVTITTTPSAGSSSSSPAPTTSTATTPTTTSPAPPAANQTKISGTCDTLLPDGSILDAINVNTLGGTDAFVVGQPEPNIGRIAYLNCRYGVVGTGAAAKPKIEIGISLYSTADKAATRLSGTIDDYTAHGASAANTTVNGLPATMLTGGIGANYAVPTLVVASGQRTVAVSVDPSVATGDKARADATALAALALDRTAR